MKRVPWQHRWYGARMQIVLMLVAQIVFAQLVLAQTTGSQTSAPTGRVQVANNADFDVISIRRSKPGEQTSANWKIELNGYSTSNQMFWYTIMIAYFPQGFGAWSSDRLKGAPAWVKSELYDINAKISAEDFAAWQQQGKRLEDQEMFRTMLESMLADRCHMIVHRIPSTTSGLVLQVSKGGPRFKATTPGETIPSEGMRLPGGGTVVRSNDDSTASFYGVTMGDLAWFLTIFVSHHQPVQDQTGLAGKYDVVLQNDSIEDDSGSLSWDLKGAGFDVKRVQIPIDTLVIDHIERPSEN